MPATNLQPSLTSIKIELEKECERIKAVLKRRAHRDPKIKNNFIADFTNIGAEVDDDVFEEEEYEVNLAIEHVLEKRLKQVEEDLRKIEEGTYQV
ncbi:MAG: hypothetical protein ABH896_01755 [Candidatus Jacksonbacteria bacterium]